MKDNGSIWILVAAVLGIGFGVLLMVIIFKSEKDKHPDTYWRDEHYEQIVTGEQPKDERMNNTSVNLRSPIRKVYIGSNTNYTPTWTRENMKNFKIKQGAP